MSWTTTDFEDDGDVNINDFNFLATNFAPTGYDGSAITVPKPAGVLWALVLAADVKR